MPTTTTTPPPTLLSLTAPNAPRSEAPAADSEFTAALRVESDAIDAVGEAASPEREATDAADDEAPAAAAAEAAETDDASVAKGDSEESLEPGEAVLLSVAPAIETIIAETAPTAVLPEEAATVLDVTIVAPAEPIAADALEDAGLGENAPPPVDTTDGRLPSEPVDPVQAVESAELATVLPQPSDNAPEATEPSEREAVDRPTAVQDVASNGQPGERPLGGDRQALPADAAEASADAAEAGADGDGSDAPESPPATAAEPTGSDAEGSPATDAARATTSSSDSTPREPAAAPAGPTAPRAEAAESLRSVAPAPTIEIDPARFVSRVSRAFEFASERGGGPVEMRLSPPELGSMQVKIEVREGVLTAQIETETQSARNALLDNLPALRERLEQQQIRIEQFNVDVRDEGRPAPDFGRSDEQPGDEANQPGQRDPGPQRGASDPAATERATLPLLGSDGRINVMA
ncbi:MAG: flagellar hook-length control protein FliK [Planctomycetota bacterium]